MNAFDQCFVSVAASDSGTEYKNNADFVCTGEHDEITVQKAIDAAALSDKGVMLYNGVYHIDGFYDRGDGGPRTALCFPTLCRELVVTGQNRNFNYRGNWKNGTVFLVSDKAFEGCDESVDVMRSAWTRKGILNGNAVSLHNIAVSVWDSTHPVRCIDFRRTDFAEAADIRLETFGRQHVIPDTELHPMAVPAYGCIGMTLTDGSNHPGNNFVNIIACGFDEGIQVGGEHAVLVNCYCSYGRYGFTFGHYAAHNGLNHPITLINCADERNINLPLFDRCGDNGGDLPGYQEVTMINFNIERLASQTPGGVLGDFMRETVPGIWRGRIEATLQPAWHHVNEINTQLWENDGSGSGIITRNSAHKAVCSSEERRSYYPTSGQQVFDTDLNRMLICTDPEKRIWVDMLGTRFE